MFTLWQMHGIAPNQRGTYETFKEAAAEMARECEGEAEGLRYIADHFRDDSKAITRVEWAEFHSRNRIFYWIECSDDSLL